MSKNNYLAPIVVFAYNRVDHLERSLLTLSDNLLAKESDLIVFSDGPKNENDLVGVTAVRDFLEKFKNTNAFKSIEIVKAKENKGLASSIISGVTTIINKSKKVIVVEDDVVTSLYFLTYMNDGLQKYKEIHKIGSIASYVPSKISLKNTDMSVFLSKRPSSIAWATWIDRWETTDWDLKNYHKEKYNFKLRRKINSWGNDVAGRLDRYVAGYNNSWAVRFTVSRIKQDQFAVHPFKSVSNHIGFDGSGTNTSLEDFESFHIKELYNQKINVPNTPPELDTDIQNEYLKQYKRSRTSELGEYFLVAVLGFKKNSLLIRFSRKLSSAIKKIK